MMSVSVLGDGGAPLSSSTSVLGVAISLSDRLNGLISFAEEEARRALRIPAG